MPKMDVVIVTSTSLLNHTLDGILDCCGGAREVALVGPSTPLAPEVFMGTPVTVLAGMVVRDTERAMKIVSQGCGTMLLGRTADKLCIRLDRSA